MTRQDRRDGSLRANRIYWKPGQGIAWRLRGSTRSGTRAGFLV